jgi:hypothetical protein
MKAKPKKGIPLHMHIALGGSPKTFKGAVPNAVANRKKK